MSCGKHQGNPLIVQSDKLVLDFHQDPHGVGDALSAGDEAAQVGDLCHVALISLRDEVIQNFERVGQCLTHSYRRLHPLIGSDPGYGFRITI